MVTLISCHWVLPTTPFVPLAAACFVRRIPVREPDGTD